MSTTTQKADDRWFIQPMQSFLEESPRTVLSGTPFANKLVKVFDTTEEAEAAVRKHNALLNAKREADAPAPSETAPAAQPDVSAVVDLHTGEIVHVTVTGPTASGKSAICGIIAQALKRSDVPVAWPVDDWLMIEDSAIRAREIAECRPSVRLREVNLSRAAKHLKERSTEALANDIFWLGLEPRFANDKDLLSAVADRLEYGRRSFLARQAQMETLELKLNETVRARDELQAKLDAFLNDRLYVLGCNAGYEAAEEHAKFDLGRMSEEVIELREDRVVLREAIEAAILKIRGFAGADESDVEFLKKALGQPQEKAVPTNRFDSYSLADLAGQCRMQARETLDPELTDFWEALNRRLTSVDAALTGSACESRKGTTEVGLGAETLLQIREAVLGVRS